MPAIDSSIKQALRAVVKIISSKLEQGIIIPEFNEALRTELISILPDEFKQSADVNAWIDWIYQAFITSKGETISAFMIQFVRSLEEAFGTKLKPETPIIPVQDIVSKPEVPVNLQKDAIYKMSVLLHFFDNDWETLFSKLGLNVEAVLRFNKCYQKVEDFDPNSISIQTQFECLYDIAFPEDLLVKLSEDALKKLKAIETKRQIKPYQPEVCARNLPTHTFLPHEIPTRSRSPDVSVRPLSQCRYGFLNAGMKQVPLMSVLEWNKMSLLDLLASINATITQFLIHFNVPNQQAEDLELEYSCSLSLSLSQGLDLSLESFLASKGINIKDINVNMTPEAPSSTLTS